jgi:phage gp36-like protein
MAYCEQDDLQEQAPLDELIALTDDQNTGRVDEDTILRAIADGDAEIDAAIGGRYTLPLASTPAIIRRISVDLALYALYSRRAVLGLPEVRQIRRDAAVRLLRDLATGLMVLQIASEPVAQSGAGIAVAGTSTPIFDDAGMEGY